MGYHYTLTGKKDRTISSVGEDTEKLDPSYIAGHNVKWSDHFGKEFISFLKSQIWLTIQPCNFTSRNLLKRNENIYTHEDIPVNAASFIIAPNCKQDACPSSGEWINKMWGTYTMEYYSAMKKNKRATTQMHIPYCSVKRRNRNAGFDNHVFSEFG